MKISVETKTRLNGEGQVGAWLLIGGTAAAGLLYAIVVNADLSPAMALVLSIMTAVLGLLPLGGIVLLLIGRDYVHDVTVNPKEKQEESPPPPPPKNEKPYHTPMRNRGFA